MLWLGPPNLTTATPPHSMHESKVHGGEDLVTKLVLFILMNCQFVCRGILSPSIYVLWHLNGGRCNGTGEIDQRQRNGRDHHANKAKKGGVGDADLSTTT
jgi:hypothetical protein